MKIDSWDKRGNEYFGSADQEDFINLITEGLTTVQHHLNFMIC